MCVYVCVYIHKYILDVKYICLIVYIANDTANKIFIEMYVIIKHATQLNLSMMIN